MSIDGQQAVLALLADPASYDPPPSRVERIDTHISSVFLAGERAFKLKRAVRLPFLDFSTLCLREQACRRELAINRRTAPDLYEALLPITRAADGVLRLGGEGTVEDWLVVMRRFRQEDLFDRLALRGALDRPLLSDLADAVAALHDSAEPRPDWGGADGLRHTIDTNAACFALDIPGLFDPVLAGEVTEHSLDWLIRLAPLLEERRRSGWVRHVHGDLHLGNICLFQGRPTLFDAIEFNETFACVDSLYDLSFLLMDLHARGLTQEASWVFNRYQERRDDLEGMAALPLFLSLRAAIRAHVAAATARAGADPAQRDKAMAHLHLARRYLSPAEPRLLAVGGLSGSGKSRLGRDLAPLLGAAPGAVVIRTDVIRKRLMGVAPETRLPPEGYSPEMTQRTYETFLNDCQRALAAGQAVVADAVFAREDQRRAMAELAEHMRVPFDGLWLQASPEAMRERVAKRVKNASDATPEVLDQQLTYDLGNITWTQIDSSGLKEETFRSARLHLGL